MFLFYFSPIIIKSPVEITFSYSIDRNLRTFVPFSQKLNIAYRKECCYDKKYSHLQINIRFLRFFIRSFKEFKAFYTFYVSLNNGFRGWKNAYFSGNLFLLTGLRNFFLLEFIFRLKFLE